MRPRRSTSRSPSRYGWCGAASAGTSLNQPLNDCGSLTRARTSTRPARRVRSSLRPAVGSRAKLLTRRPQAGSAGVWKRTSWITGGAVSTNGFSFPGRPERVHEHAPIAVETPFGEMQMPPPVARPSEQLACLHPLTRRDTGIDVPVPEVTDAHIAAHPLQVSPRRRPRLRSRRPGASDPPARRARVDRRGLRCRRPCGRRRRARDPDVGRGTSRESDAAGCADARATPARPLASRSPNRRSAPGSNSGMPPECVHVPETAVTGASGFSSTRRACSRAEWCT